MKSGLQAGKSRFQDEELGSRFKPQPNRTYLADSISLALDYALVRGDADKEVYLFKIPGAALNDLTLDEDAVIQLVELSEGKEYERSLGDLMHPLSKES